MKRPRRTYINPKSLLCVGVPKAMHNIKISDLDIPSEKYEKVVNYVAMYISSLCAMSFEDFKNNYKGICFMGSNGTGKTLLSSLILKEAYACRYSCKRITFTQYVSIYTESWGNNEISLSPLTVDDIKNVEFLVLEEIGKEIDSKVTAPILEDLLRYREDNGLITIICTNSDVKNLTARYGESIMSLIAGATTRITLTGTDFRKFADKSAMQGGLASAT